MVTDRVVESVHTDPDNVALLREQEAEFESLPDEEKEQFRNHVWTERGIITHAELYALWTAED